MFLLLSILSDVNSKDNLIVSCMIKHSMSCFALHAVCKYIDSRGHEAPRISVFEISHLTPRPAQLLGFLVIAIVKIFINHFGIHVALADKAKIIIKN